MWYFIYVVFGKQTDILSWHHVFHVDSVCLKEMYLLIFFAASRVANFIVVASDIPPPIANGYTLVREGYRECGQYQGTPAASEVSTIHCAQNISGQYLFLYIPHANYMHFCEVEAYGIRK